MNSHINTDEFLSTWGNFSIIYLLIKLPPGSEAATYDVAEAYHTIPLHPSQWPAAIVRVSDSLFCIDICAAFGAAPSSGVYGHVTDGIGPLEKWVDNHIFFRIRKTHLACYNSLRTSWNHMFTTQGINQTGSRLWYGGISPITGQLEELSEDSSHALRDLSGNSPHSSHDFLFSSSMHDIDALSAELGILWALEKDQPFQPTMTYIGFLWDLDRRTVSLSPAKVDKYLTAIHKWRKCHTHTLQDVQELYGKLLHASSAIPQGHAYLTGLESMLSTGRNKPFLLHQAGEGMAQDLDWWSHSLQSGHVSHPILPPLPLTNLLAFSDASSGIGIGITIGNHWCAWRLIPGWKTCNGKRDIGWAEAIGFELLIYSLTSLFSARANILIHGDNTGVVKGWWKSHCHRNRAVNLVFRCIHDFLANLPFHLKVNTTYVASAANPANGPS